MQASLNPPTINNKTWWLHPTHYPENGALDYVPFIETWTMDTLLTPPNPVWYGHTQDANDTPCIIGDIYLGKIKEIQILGKNQRVWIDIGEPQTALLDTQSHTSYTLGQRLVVQIKTPERIEQHSATHVHTKGAVVSDHLHITTPFMVLEYAPWFHQSPAPPHSITYSQKIPPALQQLFAAQLTHLAPPIHTRIHKFMLRTRACNWQEHLPQWLAYVHYVWQFMQQQMERIQRACLQKKVIPPKKIASSMPALVQRILMQPPTTHINIHSTLREHQLTLHALQSIYTLTLQHNTTDYWTPVHTQFHHAQRLLHTLHNGAHIRIEHTHTLTAIDVDSGACMEDALTINRSACDVILQCIAVQRMGGIIIIDFLKMPKRAQRSFAAYLHQRIEHLLAVDGVTTYCGHISPLGLVEISRQHN